MHLHLSVLKSIALSLAGDALLPSGSCTTITPIADLNQGTWSMKVLTAGVDFNFVQLTHSVRQYASPSHANDMCPEGSTTCAQTCVHSLEGIQPVH